MSLKRFSLKPYAFYKNNFAIDLLVSLGMALILPLYLLFKSKLTSKPSQRATILFDCGDKNYYKMHFKKIEENLNNVIIKKAGHGLEMDYPPQTMVFSFLNSLRISIFLLLLTPYLLVLSLIFHSNFLRAMIRSCIIFSRAFFYFKKYPADVYLTYADNSCSPPMYAAFKAAGGKSLCAFQNGIRFENEGIDFACFDHFFSIGQHFVDTYLKKGAFINRHTEIGSLTLGNNANLVIDKKENIYDIMFIDQGFPIKDFLYWGEGGYHDVKTFLEFIRRFALENQNLKLVYQLRCYDQSAKLIEESLKKWFAGISIIVNDGCQPMKSYQTITESKVIVTMCSTLGLAAYVMGKVALFYNFDGNQIYNVVSEPFQTSGTNYDEFCRKIFLALQEKIDLKNLNVNYYISSNTFSAPKLVANAICEELNLH